MELESLCIYEIVKYPHKSRVYVMKTEGSLRVYRIVLCAFKSTILLL